MSTVEPAIPGVEFKELVTHADRRGFFRELVRASDGFFQEGFAQWSHSLMFDGVIKAWHLHRIQTDWFYVASGVARLGLADVRRGSAARGRTMDLLLGDHQSPMVVKIPPGVAHGIATVQGPVSLLYLTSHEYNPDDELRMPLDTEEIRFDWLSGPPIR